MAVKTLAWRWYKPSEPEALQLEEIELPELGDDQVLIANQFIGLNPVDWKMMEWIHQNWQPGQIPGVDGMGKVIAIGKNVGHVRLGSRVAYHTNLRRNGSFSQQSIVDAKALIAVPDNVSDPIAAAFPCPGLTAWQALKKLPQPQNKAVLVSGAGGSVGLILTQLLLAQGARVYCTASPHRHEALIALGVSAVFDYHDDHWHQQLSEELNGQSLYAAIDTVSGENAASLSGLLGYYGHLVSIQDRVETSPLSPFTTCISLHEVGLASIHQYGSAQQWHELVHAGEEMLQAIGRGEIELSEAELFDFEQLPQALSQLKSENDGVKRLIYVDPMLRK